MEAAWRRHLAWLAPTASALLLFVAFLPGNHAWAGFIWSIPLALWAAAEPAWKTWRRATALASGALWLALLAWLRHLYPPLGLIAWVAVSAYCAAYLFAWLLALRWVFPSLGDKGWTYRLTAMLGLAGFWIGLEALRGWALTGFGWLPLAASQVGNPVMLSLCEVTGQLGLSGALILANLGVARWIRRQLVERRAPAADASLLGGLTPEIYLGFAPVVLAFALHIHAGLDLRSRASETRTLTVAAVQTDFDPNAKWDAQLLSGQLETLRELTAEAAASKPDLILMPEAVIAVLPLRHPGYLATLQDLSREAGCPLILGAIDDHPAGYTNAIAAVDAQGVVSGNTYAKQHLVPFGEYVPLADILPLRKIVPISRDCVRGGWSPPIILDTKGAGPVTIGPLVCYEDVFPELARRGALARDVLVVLTNDAWYGRELGAWQHAAHSSLLAAATRLPVLRCGNAGWSGTIDAFGRASPALREGTIYFRGGVGLTPVTIDPERRAHPTFWVMHGDWILAPSLALAALAALLRRRAGGPTQA